LVAAVGLGQKRSPRLDFPNEAPIS